MIMRTGHSDLGDLMQRVAEELAHLCRLSAHIEQALSHCTAGQTLDRGTLCGLQAIDRLSQSLADLAQLMQALAVDSTTGAACDTADLFPQVRLRDLAERLFPRAASKLKTAIPGNPTSAGDVHFL